MAFWKPKPQTPQPQQPLSADALIAAIANQLKAQFDAGNVTLNQLSDIHNLATDTNRLIGVLKWL